MAFDWQAGLGEGFKSIGPAIQLLLMLQQAKQEEDARQQRHTETITSADRRAQADRDQTTQLANMQGERQRRQDFLGPLQRQGIFPGSGDYGKASRIEAPPPSFDMDPTRGAMQAGRALAGAVSESEQ